MLGPADAEDAVQEALTRAWRKRESCRTPTAPLPWLLQITRNEAFRLMSRHRDEPDPGPTETAAARPPGSDPEEIAARADVQHALARLSAQERLLLHLRYREDLTHKGIAALTATPEGTTKVRLHRARERLRRQLTEGP